MIVLAAVAFLTLRGPLAGRLAGAPAARALEAGSLRVTRHARARVPSRRRERAADPARGRGRRAGRGGRGRGALEDGRDGLDAGDARTRRGGAPRPGRLPRAARSRDERNLATRDRGAAARRRGGAARGLPHDRSSGRRAHGAGRRARSAARGGRERRDQDRRRAAPARRASAPRASSADRSSSRCARSGASPPTRASLVDVSMKTRGWITRLDVASLGAPVRKGETLFLLLQPGAVRGAAGAAPGAAQPERGERRLGARTRRSAGARGAQAARALEHRERGRRSHDPARRAAGRPPGALAGERLRGREGRRRRRRGRAGRAALPDRAARPRLDRGGDPGVRAAAGDGRPGRAREPALASRREPRREPSPTSTRRSTPTPGRVGSGSSSRTPRASCCRTCTRTSSCAWTAARGCWCRPRPCSTRDRGASCSSTCGEGRLAPREIEIGAGNGEVYEVLSGLEAGETVVSSGNFLVAAESRLESALSQW